MELIILLIVLILFIIAVAIFGGYLLSDAVLLCGKKNRQIHETVGTYKYADIAKLGQKQTFSILSPRGYNLSCILLKHNEQTRDNKKIIILTPLLSIAENLKKNKQDYESDLVNIFYKNGFDVFIYEPETTPNPPFCTMGFYEKQDLKAIHNWILDFYDSELVLGIYGRGVGAVSAIMHPADEKRITFIIVDSLFTNLRAYLKNKMKLDYNISHFPILNIAELFIKNRANFSINDVSPLKNLKHDEISVPILFIHGENDLYANPGMLVQLYNSKGIGYKKYYYAKYSGHCEGFDSNPNEYEKNIDEFLQEIGIVKLEENTN